jgi:chorismate mutase/prephenate dehydratase
MARGERVETATMRRARRRIDAVDRRIVALLNERTRLGLEVGTAKAADGRAVRDPDREREVLLRVAAANEGPLPQVDLLALYRRLMSTTRRLEAEARRREVAASKHGRGQPGG